MKFLMAIAFYLLAAVILSIGILLTLKGNPWVLIGGAGAYALMLGLIGCLPPKTEHH